MPFAGLNMATPIERAGTSQIYLIPDPETSRSNARKAGEIRMLILKFFELLLCSIALLAFVLSTDASVSTSVDLITAAIMGLYLMYPLMVLSGPVKSDYNKLVFFNIIGALMLIILGLYGAAMWWDMEFDLEEQNYDELDVDALESLKYGANMKIFSATFIILTSVIYFIDSSLMLLNILGFKL